MKVVIIHGQNHKGSTYHIARMIAEKSVGHDGQITDKVIWFMGEGLATYLAEQRYNEDEKIWEK